MALHNISSLLLNMLFKNSPRKEAKAQATVFGWVKEKILGINSLDFGNLNVDFSEV
jgi:hypothetical protein